MSEAAGGISALRPSRSYFVAANAETIRLAMRGGDEEKEGKGGASSAAPPPQELRLLLAAAACQFVEARHGVCLQRDTWRVMVRWRGERMRCRRPVRPHPPLLTPPADPHSLQENP